jgi:hypothetical protein
MSTIICPSCKKTIELSEALKHQLEEEVLAVQREKFQKELEEAKKQAVDSSAKELTALKDEMRRKEQLLKEAQDAELEIRKEKNQLAEEKRTFELDKQRQLDSEREKIRQKASEEVMESQRMKEKEKDKVIDDLKKSLEDAQRKATQGSQQLQGEVAELDLEQLFRQNFPQDFIEEVGKGVLGADIRHTVKSPLGTVCGTILWESKRTKSWSDGWLGKLKGDVLADKAHVCAIVTESLPEEAKNGMGYKDGVWITSPALAISLAMLLRKQLLEVTKQKKIDENKLTKAESLYAFVTGHEFQHQVEEMITVYLDMQNQITRERVQSERLWKLREQQVQRLLSGVSGIYGSMQGIAGNALPTVKGLELEEGNDT